MTAVCHAQLFNWSAGSSEEGWVQEQPRVERSPTRSPTLRVQTRDCQVAGKSPRLSVSEDDEGLGTSPTIVSDLSAEMDRLWAHPHLSTCTGTDDRLIERPLGAARNRRNCTSVTPETTVSSVFARSQSDNSTFRTVAKSRDARAQRHARESRMPFAAPPSGHASPRYECVREDAVSSGAVASAMEGLMDVLTQARHEESTRIAQLHYNLGLAAFEGGDGTHDGRRRSASRTALEHFLQGAALGHVKSMVNAAIVLQRDTTTLTSRTQAKKLLAQACKLGDARAMVYVGTLLKHGSARLRVKRNSTLAMRMFRCAATKGDADALIEVAMCHLEGSCGCASDVKTAFEYAQRAAVRAWLCQVTSDHGVCERSKEIFGVVAYMYRNGIGTSVDIQLAKHWQYCARACGNTVRKPLHV